MRRVYQIVGKASRRKALILKIAITWLCIFLLVGFFIATRSAADPVTMSITPSVPKEGEPVVATFTISNPTDEPLTTIYQLYVNGELAENGSATVAPRDSSKYQYAHANPLKRGEQVNFVLKTSSSIGSFDKIVSLPGYPSQSMSSFVSFAAFSTSVMSSMISMEYFTNTFDTASGFNIGIIICAVLIALFIFLELTPAVATTYRQITLLRSYRAGFRIVSTILFIIFVGMVFTKVVMIIVT